MKFQGTVSIKAPRKKVWDFLTDPKKVSGCAPGLESLEVIEPDKKFRATTSIGFGMVKVRFVNDVEWVEMDAAEPRPHEGPRHGAGQRGGRDDRR